MKYLKLETIVKEHADALGQAAAYGGYFHDGGRAAVISRLEAFKQKLIHKYDLRPSEYIQLDSVDVGEPEEFSKIIEDYKLKIAKSLIKNIVL